MFYSIKGTLTHMEPGFAVVECGGVDVYKRQLLTWYRQNARILPWREEPTPYRVWISEIMLQQTRVEACLLYTSAFVL